MAIAFDSAGSVANTIGTAGGNINYSHTVNSATNGVLVVMAGNDSANSFDVPGTITYNSVPMTKIVQALVSVQNSLWYVKNPSTGTNTISVQFGTSGISTKNILVTSVSLTGVDQTTPIQGSIAGSAISTSGSISLTPSSDNAWIVGGEYFNGTATAIDATTGQTQRAYGSISTKSMALSTNGPISPAAVTRIRQTSPSSGWRDMVGAILKPAAATGITVEGSTAAAEQNNISAGTLSHIVASGLSGGLLVLASQTRNDANSQNGTITSATYAGSALTRIDLSRTTSSRFLTSELWYIVAPNSGTNNLIVNYAGTPAVAKFGAVTLSGVDQTNPIDTFASGSSLSQGTPWTVTGTTVADNDYIINSIYNSYDFSMSVSNSETTVYNTSVNSGGDQVAVAYKGPLTPAGAFTTGYQGTGSAGDEYVLTAVALRPTGGALPSSGLVIGSKLLLGVGA